jgi:hypothetical protein
MGTLDQRSFPSRAGSDTGHVLDEIAGYTESLATAGNDVDQQLAVVDSEDESIYALCAYEDGSVIIKFISEDKLMHLMGQPANDDGRNRVP